MLCRVIHNAWDYLMVELIYKRTKRRRFQLQLTQTVIKNIIVVQPYLKSSPLWVTLYIKVNNPFYPSCLKTSLQNLFCQITLMGLRTVL